ncbi:MAG: sortase [Clostridia bacterium]|nr:sortase [Clostridia bacterium]
MKKRKFPVALALGAALVFLSFAIMAAQQIRVWIGNQNCKETTARMESLLPERSHGLPEGYSNPNMPTLEIDGVNYVALVEIPALGVRLPVADTWDTGRLYDSPARFYGSAYNHTLVIGGEDNANQFGFCDTVDQGVTVIVTDMTGTQFTYRVAYVERSNTAESQWLAGSDYDLTLFCRGAFSTEYIAVRCEFA